MSNKIEVVYVAMKDDSDEDATTLISYVNRDDKWIIDSGCSHYMTGDKNKFKTFEICDGNNVKFRNNAPCPVKGKGFVVLIDKITCENTYFVKGMNNNLLSVAKLNKLGYKVEFNQKKALIYNSEGELSSNGARTKGNLFYLDESIETCLMVKSEDVWLWHKRLCHVNFDSLVNINKMMKLRGLPILKKLENTIYKQC